MMDAYVETVHPQHQAVLEFDSIDSDMHGATGGAAGNKPSAAAGVKGGQEVPLDKSAEAYQD